MIGWRIVLAGLCLGPLLSLGQGREFRGLWVDTFQDGIKNHEQVAQLVADARASHFNALLVEVRKRGDAYYQTQLEPLAEELASDYDPLADLLIEARTNGPPLEVHAWFVTYPVWNRRDDPPRAKSHLWHRRSDWLCRDAAGQTWTGDNYFLDPGHPQVQAHLFAVAMDLISRYDLDGFHFDYVRYPGVEWGYNPAAVQRFNTLHGLTGKPKPQDPAWLQYRRDQVTSLVRKIYLSATALKPSLKISAATITWTPSLDESVSWQQSAAYVRVLQDWRAWMEEGILDLNIPMAYFRQHLNGTDWDKWSVFIKDHRYERHAVLGLGYYLNTLSANLHQIQSARALSPAGNLSDGIAIFSYHTMGGKGGAALAALAQPDASNAPPVFANRVETPPMPWKTNRTMARLMGHVSRHPEGEAEILGRMEVAGPTNLALTVDATGFYGLTQVPPGGYVLTATAPGRQLRSYSINLGPGQTVVQSIRLELQTNGAPGLQKSASGSEAKAPSSPSRLDRASDKVHATD